MKNITRHACFLMAVCLICCSLVSCSSGITTSGSTATSESAASDFTALADYEKNTGALNFKSCRTTESQTPFGRENETVLRCLTPAKTLGTIPEQAAEKLEQGMSISRVVEELGNPCYSNIQCGEQVSDAVDLVYSVHLIYQTDKGTVLLAELEQNYKVYAMKQIPEKSSPGTTLYYPEGLTLSSVCTLSVDELLDLYDAQPVSKRITDGSPFRWNILVSVLVGDEEEWQKQTQYAEASELSVAGKENRLNTTV